jgi:hypothetical protein
LTFHLKRIIVSEKMIEDDLSWVEESATKSTYKSGVGFERCEDKGKKRAPKFVPTFNYQKEEEIIKYTKTHYPSSPKQSFNPKREARKEILKPREEAFVYMFCGHAGHLDEFCCHRKRIEKRCIDYARNPYRDEFSDFHLILTLMLHLAFLLMLCLASLMDLTIAHMVFDHERTTLCLDALVTAHVLILVIVSRVGLVFCWRVSHSH